jgi:TonB family protein
MIKPRRILWDLTIATLLFLPLSLSPFAIAFDQNTSGTRTEVRERGLELYRQEDYQEAEIALRLAVKVQKGDLIAWHHLALTLEKLGKINDARKVHGSAAKLGETLLLSNFKATKPDSESLVSLIPSGVQYAALSGQKFLDLTDKLSRSQNEEWMERVAFLSEFAELSNPIKPGVHLGKILPGNKVTTKARILAKPEPQYTEAARSARTTGTVVLGMVLAMDGKVRAIVPIRSLPNGLTSSAIRAARHVAFTPAAKDGQSVSVFVVVEYYFNIY